MIYDRKTAGIESTISDNGRQIEDIKSIQVIGEDSYYIYTNISSVKNVVIGGFGDNIKIYPTFTADRQENAFAELSYILYNGVVSPANEDKYYNFEVNKKVSAPGSKVTEWELISTYKPAGTYNIIIYVRSLDLGVVSV